MRTVCRNSFARQSIMAERVTSDSHRGCHECSSARLTKTGRTWLYRFHVDDDQGPRHSGPIAGGKLFCSRGCAESYTGRNFNETKG